MKTLRKLVSILFFSLLIAVGIGAGANSRAGETVQKGFHFGPPAAQQKMEHNGFFHIKRWGFPATYREVQSFQATDGATYQTAYVSRPFSFLLLLTNVVLLMSFFVAVLSPITIFWRPKRELYEAKFPEEKVESQVKANANPRD